MIRLSASTLRRRVASFLLLETTVTVALSPQFDRSFSLGSISDNIADPVCLAVLARLAVVEELPAKRRVRLNDEFLDSHSDYILMDWNTTPLIKTL